MDRIIIENVRCFRERQEVPLAPLTFLVGENSTGKSTFLALTRIAWDIATLGQANFNEEPFLLGAYDQIASFRKKSKAEHFVIGWGHEIATGRRQVLATSVLGEFTSSRSQPTLRSWRFAAPPFGLVATYGTDERVTSLRAETPSGSPEINREFAKYFPLTPEWAVSALSIEGKGISSEDLETLRKLVYWSNQRGVRPYAFAPVRTKPSRTYDPVKEIIDPEGGHVPMILAGIRTRDEQSWFALRTALDEFGQASGLFGKVDVRRLGETESDPFQLQVAVGGMTVNLVDVGYGVSQILPILVDCLRGESGGTFLLQQPEVHLHPKAQAALGSFLATLSKEQGKRFLVETHSDYMVDRIRMDLRDKKHGLRPEDVQILYFERNAGGVNIHRITFDELGNLQNVPTGYRRFFLEEERRLLGI